MDRNPRSRAYYMFHGVQRSYRTRVEKLMAAKRQEKQDWRDHLITAAIAVGAEVIAGILLKALELF